MRASSANRLLGPAVALLLLHALIGCRAEPVTHASPAGGSAASRPSACDAAIPGQTDLDKSLILVGEIHGTSEIPAAFGELVCQSASRHADAPTLVVLEIPSIAQEAMTAYHESDGGAEVRRSLLEQEFWRREYQDGRSSKAMLDLLGELRRLRASGLRIVVRGMDPPRFDTENDRDAAMAAVVEEAIRTVRPAQTLVLAGNVHTRALKGYPWNGAADFSSMATRLREGHDLIALDVKASGGAAWICTSAAAAECGSHDVRSRDIPGDLPRISMSLGDLETTGYSGTLYIGKITASPPARSALD
ncbi:MAG TPA: hypothetical protein VFG76_11225 [Candidatus Polarisedimenticolia bacterium]|nr:hypothetical protein [Candidatus Polarisedimenticolia bacterium]